jgi:hypothetical protein
MWAMIEKLRMRESSVMQPPLAGPPRAIKHGGKAVGCIVRWGARLGWFVGEWFCGPLQRQFDFLHDAVGFCKDFDDLLIMHHIFER